MKPITAEDIVVGANLLCIFDNDDDVHNKWTGLIFTIDRIGRDRPIVVYGKSPISGRMSSPLADKLMDHDTFIFVNYDKMTDKEKFIYHLSGKVTLE